LARLNNSELRKVQPTVQTHNAGSRHNGVNVQVASQLGRSRCGDANAVERTVEGGEDGAGHAQHDERVVRV
jgi:hypothetical protein